MLGAAWTFSPLTVLLGGALVWMCAACVATLDGRERTHVVRILSVAIGARVLVIGSLLLATRPEQEPFLTLFPDGRYMLDRSLWIRNLWLGVTIGPHQSLGIFDPYAASSYPYLLAVLQMLAGPSPYALCLLSVCAMTAGALLIHRMTRQAFGGPAATMALASIMLWPTLFAWSLSLLRESFQFFLGAVVAAALFYLVRSSLWGRVASAPALAAAVATLSTLRSGTVEIAFVAIAVALAFRAVIARASIALTLVALSALAISQEHDRIVSTVRLAADRHIGHVMSAGRSYRLLDEKYYDAGTGSLAEMNMSESLVYLARSAAAFVVEPKPWRAESLAEMAMAPQQVAWYCALAAALVGIAIGIRRDPWLTSIFAAYPVAGLIIIAPNSGNIGTLVRHRDMIVPFVLALAAVGVAAMAHAGRRSRGVDA